MVRVVLIWATLWLGVFGNHQEGRVCDGVVFEPLGRVTLVDNVHTVYIEFNSGKVYAAVKG